MASDTLTLGFDTSAAHCAAALLLDGQLIAKVSEDMRRGQAERLMPMIEKMLTETGHRWTDVSRLGVGIGPGNFSGIRISVAAARGLALALDVHAVGVSTFEATKRSGAMGIPVVPGPRDQLYVASPEAEPCLQEHGEVEALDQPLAYPPEPAALAVAIAQVAFDAKEPIVPPAPLYIKPADAAPSKTQAPVILDADP